MQYITALNDIQSSRKMEIKYPEKRYSDRKNRFLAVYLKDGESTFDIVNLTGNTIEYSGRKYENFEFERSVNESYPRKAEINFSDLKPCGCGCKIPSMRFYNRTIVLYRTIIYLFFIP